MITSIYLIRTQNSTYEIWVNDAGISTCCKVSEGNWRTVKANEPSYLKKLVIGASFDVPGVVLTSVVRDYQHLVPSGEEKRTLPTGSATGIPEFFQGLAEHIKEQVQPQAVMVAEKTCGIDGCTVERVPGLPSHEGSRMCKSGSVASGGTRVHCACDYCY